MGRSYPDDMGHPDDEFTMVPPVYDVPPEEWGSFLKPFGSVLDDFMAKLPAESAKADQRRRMPYKEYLKSEEWAVVSRLARHRDGNRCQLCGTTDGPLDVHHLTYERRGFERLEDLITLCHVCHFAEHERQRREKAS
jgi:hypothetical protein